MSYEGVVAEIERRTGLHVSTNPKPSSAELDDLLDTMNKQGVPA